jgi:hypothetical protein
MTAAKLDHLSVAQLVARFVDLCLAQDNAERIGDIAKVNRLYDRIEVIKRELQARKGDQRRKLLHLFSHPNAQVRLKASHATLAIEPAAARQVLETLAASKIFPQSGSAGMSLDALDRGIYKPT